MLSLKWIALVLIAILSVFAGVGMVLAEECTEEEVETLPGSNIEAVYQVAGSLSQGSQDLRLTQPIQK